MSRHIFRTTTSASQHVEVTCGWDRPLQGFHLCVVNIGPTEQSAQAARNDLEGEHILESNLWWDEPHPRTFGPIVNVLNQYGITLPAEMIDEILADQRANTGNKMARHRMLDGQYFRDAIG